MLAKGYIVVRSASEQPRLEHSVQMHLAHLGGLKSLNTIEIRSRAFIFLREYPYPSVAFVHGGDLGVGVYGPGRSP